jgi:hypothetical protein
VNLKGNVTHRLCAAKRFRNVGELDNGSHRAPPGT